MGHIKERDGIDFVVDSKPLTDTERKQISEIIANYKSTGHKMKLPIAITERKKSKHTNSSLAKAGLRSIK